MTEQDDQFEMAELRRQVDLLTVKMDKLMNGGLDNFSEFGYIQFDGIDVRIDQQNGFQVIAPGAVDQPAFFFVPRFRIDADSGTPYAVLQGYAAEVAGNEDVAKMEMAVYPDAGLEGHVGLQTFNVATGVVSAYLTATSGGTTAQLILSSSGGIGELALTNAVAILSVTADPSSFTDGMIWYNSTTDLLKARINGATVTVAPSAGGSLLTDTAWAAAGDLVYGTGNDTATILSHPGSAGQVLTSTTAPNAMTWATPAGGSFSYGKAITTSQGQNLP